MVSSLCQGQRWQLQRSLVARVQSWHLQMTACWRPACSARPCSMAGTCLTLVKLAGAFVYLPRTVHLPGQPPRVLSGTMSCDDHHGMPTGDFFEPGAAQPYDVGYDYTFFCALHPSKRHEWARMWHKWLAPSAKLVTLIFPIDASINEGPPWPVTPELYEHTLSAAGNESMPGLVIEQSSGCCMDTACCAQSHACMNSCLRAGFKKVLLESVPDALSHPGREGKEALGVWERI